jgi:hypothetical protein
MRQFQTVCSFLAALALPSTATAQARAPMAKLAWLAGCWELRQGDRVTHESWMPPLGGLMLGASRTVARDSVREYEQLRIDQSGERLVYTARPSGQAEASFTSTLLDDSGVTFSNPQHDFPQRITYRRRGADSVVARIEGDMGGKTKAIDFPMRRKSCP